MLEQGTYNLRTDIENLCFLSHLALNDIISQSKNSIFLDAFLSFV